MYRLLFILALDLYTVHSCEVCEPCECNVIKFHRRFLCTANCSDRGLSSIPGTLPSVIEVIDLSYNDLHNEDLERLKLFTEYLADLNLSYNNITYLPPRSLSTASQLNVLNLDGNVLEKVDSTSFGHLKQLHKLIGIHAKTFEENTFENLEGLNDMSIVFGSKEASENIFSHLKLKSLHMNFKTATRIPEKLLNFGIDTLVDIYLNAPNVESLHENTFSGLTILKSVTIQTEKMQTLPTNLFHSTVNDDRKMPVNLVTVIIDGVKSLPRNLFDKQQSLKHLTLNNIEDLILPKSESQVDTLDLSGSTLYRISADWFIGFKNLRFLNLSRTKLIEVNNDTLMSLSSLTVLDLSYNNITNLPDALFKSSQNTIVAFNVSHNQLRNISSRTFEGVKSLEKVDMGNNKLNFIDENAFRDQFMLTDLFLNDNELVYLSSDTLFDQTSLLDLNIARNKIKHLPERLFRNARSLRRLDISGNKIQTLPHDFFETIRFLEFVSLDDNPVHCDCPLMLIRDSMPRLNLIGKCEAPPKLQGTLLKNLKLNENCLITTSPTVLLTSFSFYDASLVLSSTLDLKTFPSTISSTPYTYVTEIVEIASTSANHLYPSIVQIFNRDTPEEAIGNDFYDTFLGTSAFYIAIGCVVAVFLGALVGVAVVMARRKLRSRAYEVSETTEIPNDDIAMALRHVHEER
ncbi:unnamed protein product [Mytilus coruscus]|uniref:LRRCT domain-containing protein n=1 Tax=Mytilus coruscus TaxID=42192 RepID=A0A6J8E1Y8_MYTCO|nr:unnamed protein product [Mytilus coruscus]